MTEAFKDSDGFTWVYDPRHNGWTLLRHEDMLCYVGLPFARVEQEYGPLRPLTVYEQTHLRK